MRRIKKFDSEENLHIQVCDYLRLQYPGVLFRSAYEDGRARHPVEQMRLKRLNSTRAWPDLFIAHPMYRDINRDFYGLFIELKKEGTKLKREKDARKILKGETELRLAGDWWNKHIEEQANVLQQLGMYGYCVTFATGFDDAKKVIDKYLLDSPTARYSLDETIRKDVAF